MILAAPHDLVLSGRAPALAAAYAATDGDAAAGAAIDTLLRMTDSVVATAVRRRGVAGCRPSDLCQVSVLGFPGLDPAAIVGGEIFDGVVG